MCFFVTGGIENSDGFYLMTTMPADLGSRAVTVSKVMQSNFQRGWPNPDVVILQLEKEEGALISWKERLAQSGQKERA